MLGQSHCNQMDAAVFNPLLALVTKHWFGPIGSSVQTNIDKYLLNVWLQLTFLSKHGLLPDLANLEAVKEKETIVKNKNGIGYRHIEKE